MKTYLPYILAIAAFIIGLSLGGNKDAEKELKKQWVEKEKKYIEALSQISARAAAREARYEAREKEWYSDSTEMVSSIQAKEKAITKLEQENEKVNLTGSTAAQLDSIRAVLFAGSPLHPDR